MRVKSREENDGYRAIDGTTKKLGHFLSGKIEWGKGKLNGSSVTHLNGVKDGHGKSLRHEANVKVVETIELHEKTHSPKVKRFIVLFALFVPENDAQMCE